MNTRKQDTLKAFNTWDKRAFQYGDADCCQFTGHVIREITGIDYMKLFDYKNEPEAQSIIDYHGGLEKAVETMLGKPTTLDNLQDGDPVLFKAPMMGDALGVMFGKFIVGLSHRKIVRVSQKYFVHGWAL